MALISELKNTRFYLQAPNQSTPGQKGIVAGAVIGIGLDESKMFKDDLIFRKRKTEYYMAYAHRKIFEDAAPR